MCCDALESFIIPDAASRPARGPTKMDKCLQLIRESAGGVIVYTSNLAIVSRVTEALLREGIAAERLNKRGSVDRIVRDFNGSILRVLVLDPQNPAGLNLQKATTVVIMNEVSPQITQQVIGRAQRVGRTGPLHVHTLWYPE